MNTHTWTWQTAKVRFTIATMTVSMIWYDGGGAGDEVDDDGEADDDNDKQGRTTTRIQSYLPV